MWELRNSNLIFHYAGLEIYWVMPEGFLMPCDSVLSLAEFLLLRPFGKRVSVVPRRSAVGNRVGVAFSGGVDSSAALRLVENPVAIYTQVANPSGMHKIENALMATQSVNGLCIVSNYDVLAVHFGKRRGFYGQAGWVITGVLLSDFLGLNVLCDGNIVDFAYLRSSFGHGTKYTVHDYSEVMGAFSSVGLSYAMPCAGLSEVSTTKIAAGAPYAMGCMRGVKGEPCLKCMKCYRKMAIQGSPIETNSEAEKILSNEWIPVLGAFLWARDNCGLSNPRLNGISKDIDWVDKWYAASSFFIPVTIRDYFYASLDSFGIEVLSNDACLHTWSSNVAC